MGKDMLMKYVIKIQYELSQEEGTIESFTYIQIDRGKSAIGSITMLDNSTHPNMEGGHELSVPWLCDGKEKGKKVKRR